MYYEAVRWEGALKNTGDLLIHGKVAGKSQEESSLIG